MDDASDRLLRVIEEYERVAEAVTPDVSSWGGALWRQLNDDLADPATPAVDLETHEVGGEGGG